MGVPTKTVLLLFVALAGYSQATRFGGGFSTSFSINNQLTCNVPFTTRSGLVAVPEQTLTVPIRPGPGNLYTPQPSG